MVDSMCIFVVAYIQACVIEKAVTALRKFQFQEM